LAAGVLFVVREREQQVLGGDVLVLQRARLGEGGFQDARGRTRQLRLRAAAGLGKLLEQLLDFGLEGVDPDPELLEHGDGAALGLAEQRVQQVGGQDLGVPPGGCQVLGLAQGLLALDGELVEAHEPSN